MSDRDRLDDLFERISLVLRNQEAIMADIAGLAVDVAALTAAVGNVPAPGTPPAVSTLSATDQASLDASAAAVQAATTTVSAAFPPPPAPAAAVEPAPAPSTPAA